MSISSWYPWHLANLPGRGQESVVYLVNHHILSPTFPCVVLWWFKIIRMESFSSSLQYDCIKSSIDALCALDTHSLSPSCIPGLFMMSFIYICGPLIFSSGSFICESKVQCVPWGATLVLRAVAIRHLGNFRSISHRRKWYLPIIALPSFFFSSCGLSKITTLRSMGQGMLG